MTPADLTMLIQVADQRELEADVARLAARVTEGYAPEAVLPAVKRLAARVAELEEGREELNFLNQTQGEALPSKPR